MGMERHRIVIPAAGTVQYVKLGGNAVIVESIPVYSDVDQVPTIRIGAINEPAQPLYPQSVYNNRGSAAGFREFYVEGTAESAGDELYLLISDECLESRININFRDLWRRYPGATMAIVTGDVVDAFDPADYTDGDQLASAVYLSASGEDVAFSFITDPDQTSLRHLILVGAAPIKIEGIAFIQAFKFISAVNASAGVLVATFEF